MTRDEGWNRRTTSTSCYTECEIVRLNHSLIGGSSSSEVRPKN
jgi:hypothetical protein